MYHLPPSWAWCAVGGWRGGGGAANLEPGRDNARNNVARIFILPCWVDNLQIVFTILRPSTISAIPNGGLCGSPFRSLPILRLWALPAGVSWGFGDWLDRS